MLKNPYAKNAKLTCRFLVQGLRITAEKGFYCFNLPYQMSDGPKAITRICLKVQLQVVINQYGQEETQNTKSEMLHFSTVREYLDRTGPEGQPVN